MSFNGNGTRIGTEFCSEEWGIESRLPVSLPQNVFNHICQ
jgi:hypothetical protein